jgi:hypothetical protein
MKATSGNTAVSGISPIFEAIKLSLGFTSQLFIGNVSMAPPLSADQAARES